MTVRAMGAAGRRAVALSGLLAAAVLLLGPVGAAAAEVYGTVELVEGSVQTLDSQGRSRPTRLADTVSEGETVITGRDGELHLRTEDHGLMALRSGTKFRIDAYDFSRIQKGASVDLVMPNQQQLSGTVSQIHVTTTSGGAASASIEVASPQLVLGQDNGLVTPGTPVAATLRLRDDGPLGGLRTMAVSLLQKLHL